MWQVIAKGVLGGIGGGLKEAGNTNTNLSGGNSTQTTSQTEQNTEQTIGDIGKIGKAIYGKFKKKDQTQGAE